jgi:endonuclease YncB( thermonuclease family)
MINFTMRIWLTSILVVSGLALAQPQMDKSDFEGWVITVLDGDTIRVLDGSNRITRIRLKSIDAPEKNQPFGEESRKYLASMLIGQEVKVKAGRTDGEGDILGQIWLRPKNCSNCKKTVDANLTQLVAGMAWWSSKFAKQQSKQDRRHYESAEAEAKQDKLGLWSNPEPVAPWTWRERESAGMRDES